MARALLFSILFGVAIVAPLSCGGKTAINGQDDGSNVPVTTGSGGAGTGTGTGDGTGNGGASTGSAGATGTGGASNTGAGGARADAGTTGVAGAGGARMDAGAAGTTGAVDAGIMNCMAGAVCPTIGASCTTPCGGGGGGGNLIRVCFCDPNGRVGCQACQPPPPPSCRATVTTGGGCNPAMSPPCTGCLNGQTETCTCGRNMAGRNSWTCVIPVPIRVCQ